MKYALDFIDFVEKSPSSFHSVTESGRYLLANGFTKLSDKDKWNLEKGGKYFLTKNNSSLFAFIVGKGKIENEGFKIIGSHTDSPGFRIKPNPEIENNLYLKLNIEVYGGPIINTWFDRPLSFAGRVAVKNGDSLKPVIKLVNIKKPNLIIPNLAIHQSRDLEKKELNRQTDILPVLGLLEDKLEKENFLLKLLAKELDIETEDILDFELYLYEAEKGTVIGLNNEFLSCAKIDNLAMVHSSLISLAESKDISATKVIACFDNEEVGSSTKQGAGSPMLSYILERISLASGKNREDFLRALANSFMISADGAHAVHPNFADKTDPTNKPMLNKGPVIKMSASQSYTSEAYSSAYIKLLAEKENIPVQYFVNRSNMRGGSTIGPISSTNLPINSVDLGLPMLAMHSVREMCGTADYELIIKLLTAFFNN